MTMGDRVALMKAGVLQQLGSPQHIYDNPDNIFVAGFIGSPPMNMAIARLDHAGSGYQLSFGGAVLQLAQSTLAERPRLASYAGRDIAIGIRSEDMEDAALARDDVPEARIRAKVGLTEALGSAIMVHFDVDAPKVVTADTKELERDAHTEDVPVARQGNTFVASFGPRSRVRAGGDIEIAVDRERIHYFDPESGLAIRS
jgi:multiple sugar transport system ATP-binding protein